uniref:Uncharacterized protein n=1 Tax=Arundo donax TaxID=35708 RepID=A0A0A9CP94_ARUDO
MLLFEFWEHSPFSSALNHSEDVSSDFSGPRFDFSSSSQLVGFVMLDVDEQLVDAREIDSFEEQNLVLLEESPNEDGSSFTFFLLTVLHRKTGLTSRDVVMGLLKIGILGEPSSVAAETLFPNFPFSTKELSLFKGSPLMTSWILIFRTSAEVDDAERIEVTALPSAVSKSQSSLNSLVPLDESLSIFSGVIDISIRFIFSSSCR